MSQSVRRSTDSNKDEIENTEYDIYDVLHVQKPHEIIAPAWRRCSWRWHSRLLPLLHFGQGDCCPPDVFVNLRVLWNKALTSLDPKSLAYEARDHFPTFHMLPWLSRWILFRVIPLWMYPRWFHANIELRTVYLNRAMDEEIQSILRRDKAASIQIVVLGGGYDTRSIRTLIRYPQVTRAWELDLKPVVDSKRKLIQRLYCQCPLLAGQSVQTELRFLDVDLNDLDQLDAALAQIVQGQTSAATHTILLTEAVLMYLNEGIPSKILQRCLKRFGPKVSWLFVDRLKDVPNVVTEDLVLSRKAATEYFASDGWDIVDWLLKPGGTRHLGVARALQKR